MIWRDNIDKQSIVFPSVATPGRSRHNIVIMNSVRVCVYVMHSVQDPMHAWLAVWEDI